MWEGAVLRTRGTTLSFETENVVHPCITGSRVDDKIPHGNIHEINYMELSHSDTVARLYISPLGYKQPDRFNMGEEVRTNPNPFALFLQASVI